MCAFQIGQMFKTRSKLAVVRFRPTCPPG